ncbi:serine/threonine protein kinase [Klenkia marina]|uniref:non-specific serine/threonine protein kinase n=1 Tax=Klenkia marina TaxID=1960309 RepID=A0A1G4Y795_9ACTN|nr:serine/threonine-protein kinase [Klenkia marina]SCX49282.1 serine/threonine protein kinase [Klenkia marina]
MESDRFGPYRIEALIGRGGMGEVHRAYDTEHRRTVALKLLSTTTAGDDDFRERFRREAHAVARLNEPHVIPIHRYGEIDGRLFLDMRLVSGIDLGDLLHTQGALPPARAVAVVGQVARALDAAHAEGLVHRDVKPSNILVTGEPGDEFVYLVDFGIAWSASDAQSRQLTQTGSAVGSFDYMAPERFMERPIDGRTDVYSLACVLFECLVGRRPFTGNDLATMMYAHLNTAPPPVSALRGGLPGGLDEVVARGLAKDPAQRWPTAGAMAAAARAALSSGGVTPQLETATAPGPPPPTPQAVGMSGPGWGPTSTQAPGWAPAPSPTGAVTGPSPTRRRRWVPWAAGAGAAAAVAAVVAVVATSGGSGGDPSPTSTAAPTTSAAEAELRGLLPAAIADCASGDPSTLGETARLDCGPSPTQPGPSAVQVSRFEDSGAADSAFLRMVDEQDLAPLSTSQTCPGSQGYYYWRDDQRQVAGRVACYANPRGDAVLFWTQDDDQVLVVASVDAGTGGRGLADLTTWWSGDGARFGG